MYLIKTIVCGRVPWLYQYWLVGFMLFVVLCLATFKNVMVTVTGIKKFGYL